MIRKVRYRKMECFVVEDSKDLIDLIVKRGLNVYYLRHSECNWFVPYSIEKFVIVNRWGFLFTPKKMNLGSDGIRLSRPVARRFAGLGE